MRVITGSAKGVRLKTPQGLETRPTADRVKEALFSVIQFELPGSRVLDLFAGTGQLGIEALSRGAGSAVFVDNRKDAAALIKENLKKTKLEDKAKVVLADFDAFLLQNREQFDFIFLDPPYGKGLERDVLGYLQNSSLMTADTTIILEASLNEETDWVEDLGYRIRKVKKYKTNKHLFIEMDEDDE